MSEALPVVNRFSPWGEWRPFAFATMSMNMLVEA